MNTNKCGKRYYSYPDCEPCPRWMDDCDGSDLCDCGDGGSNAEQAESVVDHADDAAPRSHS
jgi:hypothetical protein